MTYSILVPVKFVHSPQFPRMCAFNSSTERLHRTGVRVRRRKNQRVGSNVPWSVSLYLSAAGEREVERVNGLYWLFVGGAIVGGLGFILVLNLLPQNESAIFPAMFLFMGGILVPALMMHAQWSKVPVVFATAQDGSVEIQFPSTARQTYHACIDALADWQRVDREARHKRRVREALEAREAAFERKAQGWGRDRDVAGESDRWSDGVEPGWDEGDDRK